MAKQVLNNGETHGVIRGKINDNFTELYTDIEVHKADYTANLQHRNILHNWDFSNPVNQRGKTSYNGLGYGIDRWKLSSVNVTLDVQSDNIKFTAVGSGDLWQYIENYQQYRGQTLTLSIELASPTVNNVAFGLYDGVASTVLGLAGKGSGIHTLTRTIDSSATELRVRIYGNQLGVTNSIEIKRVKLELGTKSTLANDPPADYGEQLALCQRYLFRIDPTANTLLAPGFGLNTTTMRTNLYLPVALHIKPTATYDTLTVTDTKSANIVTVSAIVVQGWNANILTLDITSTGLVVGDMYYLRIVAGNYIQFSAEL